ncbi:tRNA pseudouridine synthase B [Pirellula staleyi DSM 6068]|uniref:tRNA pseudouridine synthase B n=1 Tax=Pirellula staleyi (strain ATCC 27377 / DSM 6068 / ICPB 4128) TaxID=530564 RepID=D2R7P9_PIRSD|nr:tRNA pseudouridine(55) synthase TruB [Pirellula staleyi]ADB17475.1 tRNA pseudouridine synthase B [Pirellula staleyi DSM 6068]
MDGILIVNKPAGPTSRDVVNRVQRCVKPAKVGHAGTLDPLATGVLVIGIGAGTRLVEYVQQMPKTYVGQFRLGISSDTEDITGCCITHDESPVVSRDDLRRVLPRFLGKISQKPPAYSALKVEGERAYDLARRGETVELAPREIVIRRLELTRFDYPDFELVIDCESGTYVRSLGRDIASALETHAVMTDLIRTSIGSFSLERAITMDSISRETITEHLLPLLAATEQLPQVLLTEESVRSLQQGKRIAAPPVDLCLDTTQTVEVAAIDSRDRLVAICELTHRDDGSALLKPHKVMPLGGD